MVKAPSALAAAVFSGKHAHKSAKYGALIYEKDGKPYTGKCFWIKWQLKMEEPSEEHLAQIERELPFCEFVDEGIHVLCLGKSAGNYHTMKKRISDIPKSDRPKEKLRIKDAESLSDLELIAVLLGSGSRGMGSTFAPCC